MELRKCVDVLHQGLTVIEDLSIGEGVIRSRTAVYIVEGAVFHHLLYSLKVRLDMQGTHDKNGLQCDALKQKDHPGVSYPDLLIIIANTTVLRIIKNDYFVFCSISLHFILFCAIFEMPEVSGNGTV